MSVMTELNLWDRQLRMEPGAGPKPGSIKDPARMDPEEWLALRPYRHKDYGPLLEPTVLAPASLFDPRWAVEDRRRTADGSPAPRPSLALRARLARMSAGWRKRATEEDFQKALRATERDPAHRRLLLAWLLETTFDELDDAVHDGAFTMRRLAQALHIQGVNEGDHVQLVNVRAHRTYLRYEEP